MRCGAVAHAATSSKNRDGPHFAIRAVMKLTAFRVLPFAAVFAAGCAGAPARVDPAELIGASEAAVRERLGPPDRDYTLFPENLVTWEYAVEGFLRPRTLYVQFSPDQRVSDAYVLERRGKTERPRAPPR